MTIQQMMRQNLEPGGGPEGAPTDVSSAGPENNPAPGENPGGPPDFAGLIPADFRDKPYVQELLKNANPQQEFFKQFDNLQTMMGKPKIGVPAEDAPQEDWDKFYSLMRPESPEKYELDEPNFGDDDNAKQMAELVKSSRNPEFIKRMQKVAFDTGTHPKAFKAIAAEYERASAEHEQQKGNEFTESAKKAFGGDMEKAIAYGGQFLTEFGTPELKALLPVASNDTLLALSVVAQQVNKKYNKEDAFDLGGAADTGSVDELRKQYRGVIAEMLKHPRNSAERIAKKEEAGEIQKKISAAMQSTKT